MRAYSIKSNKYHIGIIIWSFCFLLSACTDFKEIEVGSPTAIIVKSIKDNKINADLSIPISNPNNLKFKITQINLDVIVNENYLGKITTGKNVLIPANSNENHLFNLNLEVKSIAKGIISIINVFGSGKVKVESKGYIKIRSGLIVKSLPVENKTSIKVRNKIPWLKERIFL